GLYDTIQYPLCHISSKEDLALIDKCHAADVGVIAMKPLSGGLLTKMRPAFAFLRQYENVVPIWGIQFMNELEEMLELDANPPALDDEMWSVIEQDRRELASEFCRACAYCMPCPVGISISMAARMSLVIKRLPWQQFVSDYWRKEMDRIEECTECGQCKSRCPYGLDTPSLLKKNLAEYEVFYREHV
ncbi:MAG: 4Fe-4S dicluster domain-containing protein, partial [Armatimonadota bacterium]|nr:4Fe-4S dicluster domain-containing protein [Armatimonadota bacterium]